MVDTQDIASLNVFWRQHPTKISFMAIYLSFQRSFEKGHNLQAIPDEMSRN